MQASNKLFLSKTSLPLFLAAMVFIAPAAFAKKDLFGNDPAGKQAVQPQQLAPTTQESAATDKTQVPATTGSVVEPKDPTPAQLPKPKKEPTYLEKQFARLKSNITETKNDLFGPKDSKGKSIPRAVPAAQETSTTSSESESSEAAPAISPTEAAQRAQLVATGQVMNVRKYKDEDKTRYAVKLLQKNGRMKTVTLDANSGELIEEPVQ